MAEYQTAGIQGRRNNPTAGNTHNRPTGGPLSPATHGVNTVIWEHCFSKLQGFSNLPKDRPGLGEKAYTTSEPSLFTNGVLLPNTQVGRVSLLNTGGSTSTLRGLCRILGDLWRQATQSTNTNYAFILLRICKSHYLLI